MQRELAVRLIALRDVVQGTDPEYLLRYQVRWYARTFSMSPQQVRDLVPLDELRQAFWEERYEGMRDGDEHDQADLAQERRRLGLSDEAWRDAAREEDADDADAVLRLRGEQARERADTARLEAAAKRAADAILAAAALPEDVDIDFGGGQDAVALAMLDE